MSLGIRILVVDDEGPIRTSLGDFLEDEGFETIQADSAEKALAVLKHEKHMDVAVVDIRLPGADGNAFILSAHAIYPNLKFVIYTGSTDYLLPQAVREVGVKPTDVFHKPLQDISTLTTAIRRLLGNPIE